MKPPNKYDLAFADWFDNWGWRIHSFFGEIKIWTNDDMRCPFKVTAGMVERLVEARRLQRIFPSDASLWDEFWTTEDQH